MAKTRRPPRRLRMRQLSLGGAASGSQLFGVETWGCGRLSVTRASEHRAGCRYKTKRNLLRTVTGRGVRPLQMRQAFENIGVPIGLKIAN